MMAKSRLFLAAVGAAALLSLAGRAGAQSVDSLRKKYMIPEADIATLMGRNAFFRGAPGTSSGTPIAFGADWGDLFVGGGYQSATRTPKLPNGQWGAAGADDGSISVGGGIGNSHDAVGVGIVMTSLSTFRSGFGNRTAFSFDVHRVLDRTTAVAVGVQTAFIAGGGNTDASASWYGVATKVFALPQNESGLFKSVTASLGVGNGNFRTMADIRNNKAGLNVFGSASVLVTDWLSVLGDYTGQDVNLGLSLVPFKDFPITLTPAIADVTQTAGKSARFTLGAGIGMHF